MKKLFPLVTFILIATLVGGCGGTKTIKTDQGSVSVSEDKNQINVKTNDGNNSQLAVSQNGEGVALPTDYPKDLVPIIDGANVNMATISTEENDGKKQTLVNITIVPKK